MGWWQQVQVGLSTVAAWWAAPTDDPARAARVATLYATAHAESAEVPVVGVAEVRARLEAGEPWVLVDVRTDAERAISTLPGAVPAEAVQADPDAFRGRTLVAYCTIGLRSGRWAKARRAEGLEVLDLEGSLLGWTHAGGPLVGPDGPTRRVHVYGAPWDLARTDYEAVW